MSLSYEPATTSDGHLATPLTSDKANAHTRTDSSYSGNYSIIDMYDCPSPGRSTLAKSTLLEQDDELDIDEDDPKQDQQQTESPSVQTDSDSKDQNMDVDDTPATTPKVEQSKGLEQAITSPNTTSEGISSDADTSGEPSGPNDSVLSFARNSNISVSTRTSSIPSSDTHSTILDVLDHSVADQISKSDFDRYGFKKSSTYQNISTKQYNQWFTEYNRYLAKNKRKWQLLMKSNGLNDVDSYSKPPNRFPPKSDKVKKLIRKGIPAEWRGNAWFFYAGGHEKLNKHTGVYEQIVRDTDNLHNKDTEVIERDLNRTFPDNIYFNKNLQPSNSTGSKSKGDRSSTGTQTDESLTIKSLRRVLVAFAHYQPHIGYCQSLNFLAGLLLLFMREERCFWMLVILTERIIPKVHSANLEGVHVDQGVLMLCIKEYIPQLWSILGKNFEGETLSEDKILTRLPPVTLVTSAWFMSVFVGNLPIETTLRVWDILWYEGSKTIFRISLTVSKMCLENPEFIQSKGRGGESGPGGGGGGAEMEQIELFQFMQNYPKTILDPNVLIDNCFKKIGGYGFGSLSQDEINKCRDFVSKQRIKLNNKRHTALTAEMSEEERKALESSGFEGDIHDVYGFHRSLMSGVAWNKNISNRMKKKFTRKN